MSEANIKFDDKKAKKFFKSILKASKEIDQRKRLFIHTIVAKHVIEDVEDHFENQQGGPSKLWPEWSNVYLNRMRKLGKQGNNILIDTGRLKNTFGPNKWRISGGEIEFFNPARTSKGFPYAAAHNEGGPKLPERRFMWLSSKAGNRIARDTLKFLLKG